MKLKCWLILIGLVVGGCLYSFFKLAEAQEVESKKFSIPYDDFQIEVKESEIPVPEVGEFQPIKLLAPDGSDMIEFGYSVAITADYAFVGAPGKNDNIGVVYIFRREGNSWKYEEKLGPRTYAEYERFGRSVSVNGQYLIIGSASAAYIYKLEKDHWELNTHLSKPARKGTADQVDDFGKEVALNGDRAIVGFMGSSAYIYVNITSQSYVAKKAGFFGADSWAQEGVITAPVENWVGEAVGIDGDLAVISGTSASGGGSVFVFRREGIHWVQADEIVEFGVGFGRSVDIDGVYLIVGDSLDALQARSHKLRHGYANSVYIFDHRLAEWLLNSELKEIKEITLNSSYGISVAINNGLALVGDDLYEGGKVFVYKRVEEDELYEKVRPGWNLSETLTAPSEQFGFSVSIKNGLAIVGAPGDDTQGDDAGAAYIYHILTNSN